MHAQANKLDQLKSSLKAFVSPSLRFEIRQKKSQLKYFFAGLCFWKWQHIQFVFNQSNPEETSLAATSAMTIHYKGRPENVPMLKALRGVNAAVNAVKTVTTTASKSEIYVTEHPMRDSIRIPFALITIVKLGRPIEDIVASYSKSLRRSINAERTNYRYQAINDITKIGKIETNMLKAYATARHDIGAAQLENGTVKKFAQKEHGRLDLLLQGDEEVGCHLGNPYTRQGKR